ncbi:methyl-accepting chemotaxis protein [Christensenellaceae bacterium OttesenSCG-928-M15]|nr:methyl-accepting chemotaxis protein [Christensenellaceae bacterium OttesenSCG-928-M15]
MRRSSIKTAILIPVLVALVLGIATLVISVGLVSSSTANDLTERIISARVNEYSNEFKALTMESYGVVNSVASVVEGMVADGMEGGRQQVVEILTDALEVNEGMLGFWTCWEPNAFDGQDSLYANADYHDATGRYIPYVFRENGKISVSALLGYDVQGDGDYYLGAKSSGKPYVTDPYSYQINGKSNNVYSIAIPVLRNGAVVGAVGADILLDDVVAIMNEGSILDDGYIFTLSPSGLVATHSSPDILLKHYNTTWMKGYTSEISGIVQNGGSFTLDAYSDVTDTNMRFLGSGVKIGSSDRHWVVCGVVPSATVTRSSLTLVLISVAIGIGIVLGIGLIVFFIVRSKLKALPQLTATAIAMAKGDVQVHFDDDGDGTTKNEIALLGRAFHSMADGIREQAQALKQIAEGDYSISVQARSDVDVMNYAIHDMLEKTNDAMHEIQTASAQVSSGSAQIASVSQELATSSSEQAATIEELSATLMQVQNKAEQNEATANETLEDVQHAGELMGDCTKAMDKMLSAMNTISDSSQNIAKVIKVIDDIAFQTNILALNAAVEAARAGQHGKGFAVVADEVRNLASKSAEAAKETAALIENSVQSVKEGSHIVDEVNESITAVGVIASKNAVSIQAINENSREQSIAIGDVTGGINELSTIVQANAATAEETAASSEEMSAQSVVLNEALGRFQLKDN